MRKIYSLILLFSILLISFENISAAPSIRIGAQTSYGQRIEMPAFSMKAQDRFFSMGKSYSSDSHISLSSAGNISSLGVSGNVILKGDDSFIRIILVGQDGKEYLIYQADTIISGGNKLFSLDSVCEETCALPAVKPKEVRLEMNKSTLYLSNIAYDSGLSFESQASAVKASQQEYKIERVKDFINRNNLRWEAGETTISGLSYEEKKKFFLSLDGNMTKVPNLQGLEYYVGGVFEFVSDAPSTLNVGASSLPASWNWNNVNGKNWLTSFKDQGRVGTCWSFASLGAMESQIRMYFNQPSLDINLSEQMLVDCTTGQRSAYAMNQIYVSPNPYKGSVPNCFYSDVNYYVISQKGIADEACNRYVERDVASSPSSVVCSRTTCSDWDSRTWKNSSYYGYQFSLNLGDSYCPNKQRGVTAEGLKKLIIEKGPMDVGIVVDGNSGHAMVLVGYETDTDGSTIWIFKNSWGSTGSGTYKPGLVMDRGYLKAKISMNRIIYASLPIGPFIPPTNSSYWPSGFDNTIKCEDNDKDGYCYWGSSTSKPSTCPSTCATEKDCNDSDAKKNAFDSNYQCVAKALKIDGQCGPSHNQTFGSAPVAGLCNSGTASTVSGSGPWTWTCNGSGGGSNASCRAEKSSTACNWTCGAWSACTNGNQTRTCTSSPSGCTGSNPYPTTQPCSSKIDGQCGPSHNQTFGSAPVTGLCNSGAASTVSGSGPWTWTCNGSGGGSNASCRAEKSSTACNWTCGAWSACTNGTQTRTCTFSPNGCTGSNPYPTTQPCSSKIDGVCGAAHGKILPSKPTTDLCLSGTDRGVFGIDVWTWVCLGSNGGSNANCRAEKGAISGCGSAARHYDYTETGFVGDFCSSGHLSSTPSFPAPGQTVTWNCLNGSGSLNWVTRKAPEDNEWLALAYGNGVFVALSLSGTNQVMTSPDGINWTARKMPGDYKTWYSVAYGNGLFVAVGWNDQVVTSPDGIRWTLRSIPVKEWWRSVTYGNGLFVAVAMSSGDNRVMTSPDGVKWTIRRFPENNSMSSVAYGKGLFVAVAGNGTNRIMTSPDGINWTARKSPENNWWRKVIYANGLFVAVAGNGTNRIMTSPDGINWTARKAPGDEYWFSVAYGDGLFVAIATNGNNRLMTSPDGINWTIGKAPEINDWYEIVYDNGMFVAVSTTGTNRIMTSSAGTSISCQADRGTSSGRIEGQCGPSHNHFLSSEPVTGLCNSGTPSTVSGSGPWTWSCRGSNGGSNAVCKAFKASQSCTWTCDAWSACINGTQTRTCTSSPDGCTGSNPYPTTQPCSSKIDGQCGPSHNQILGSAPITGLCNSGTPSTVSGSGPWTWTCNGSNGGSNASCRANKGSTPTIVLSCSASSSSSITCDVSGASGAIYYNLHYFDNTVRQSKIIGNIRTMPHTINGLKCGPDSDGHISNYNSFQVQACGPAGMFEFSKGNYSCTNYIGRANGTIGTYVDLPCVSNSACGVANNTSTVITPTSGLCADGSSPHVLASGNQWTWKCGSTSCSATDPNAPYKGMFSATEMPTFTGQGDNPDTAEVWLQWHCSSGFPKAQTIFQNYEQVSCTYGSIGSHGGCTGCAMSKFTIKKKGLAPISGQCGSSHGQSMDSVPVTGLCNSGTPSAVSGSGPWTWVCEGVSGGSNASCRAEKSSTFCNWTCSDWSACINGKQTRTCTSSGCLTGKPETEKACSPTGKVSCGPDHGQVLNAKPSNNLCNNGNVLASVGDGPWYWICQDYMKDETILCYARKGASQIDGACGNSHGISLPSAPSTGLCSQGTSSPVYGTGPWVWICSGVNGGKPAICFATKTTSIVVNKACGSSDGKSSVTAPTTGLCSSGNNSTIVRNDTDGNWTWQCGNETCKATDPNREYKKVFGAIEMSSYSGNPTSPDKTTIAIQDYHCNWLPSGTAYKGYKKVSCKYEPIGTHGACEKCSVVLMQIEKK
ncbi:MAG: hypothetical protein MNSN_02920 [Minisyncoccus archaeiphilus]|nr:MAG: hypothetical protein MNSN_02920 [Candidatus Parcubacteria bacterium]